MHRPVGRAAVRLSLGTLLFATLAMSLVQPVQAGTEAAPEIADPANDQAALGEAPASTAGFAAADVLFAWVDGDDGTNLNLNVRANGDILGGTAQGTPTTYYRFIFHLTVAGTEYLAEADVHFEAVAEPGGVAAAAVVDGSLVTMTVPYANIGSPAPGTALTSLFVEAEVHAPQAPVDPVVVTDRAPNADFGTDYTTAGGSGGGGGGACPNCTADDTDGDGLNDTWEQQYFGGLDENATGDPDGDGLTNGQEQELGTDPTKADTDGDGVNDNEDPFPLDPTKGGSSNTTTSSSSSSSSATDSGSSTSRSGTSSTTGDDGGDGDGEVKSLGDAIERLESDAGYLGMSAGGFLAVLILCIVALATRWSL